MDSADLFQRHEIEVSPGQSKMKMVLHGVFGSDLFTAFVSECEWGNAKIEVRAIILVLAEPGILRDLSGFD